MAFETDLGLIGGAPARRRPGTIKWKSKRDSRPVHGTNFLFSGPFNIFGDISVEQTAEEVRQEYVTAMGTELGGVFFELRNECVMLHWKWLEYLALFGTKPERIALLNEAAGALFWVVQDTL